MSWDPAWERVHATRAWGRYPPEELIRFAARHLYPRLAHGEVTALELGCGAGANLWFLAREGIRAVGVDGSPTAVERARAFLAGEGLDVELHVADVASIGELFPGRRFDTVVDVACLQHNEPAVAEAVVSSVLGLLRPGGRFFSMLVARGSYGDGVGREVGEGTYVDIAGGPLAGVGLTHFWSLAEVERLAAGFADAEIESAERTLDGRRHVYRHWLLDAGVPA